MTGPQVPGDSVAKRGFYVRFGKRIFDLGVATVALVVLSPLLLTLSLASLLFLGPPVIFTQVRAGLKGRPFTLCKFRSMLDLRDASGILLPDEQRLTAYGKLLRATSMDELPGFWNVLKGDLSLIGPRPLPPEYTRFYSAQQAKRLDAKPGMAGYAALFGRNAQPWEALFERDVWYSRNVSFALDLRTIFGVVKLVLSRQGIDRGDHDAASPFAEILKKNLGIRDPNGTGMRERDS